MKVYAVTIHRPWDGKETISVHMTRKGALQVACLEGLSFLLGVDGLEDTDYTWIEDNLYTVDNPNHTFTLKGLDGIFECMEQLLWGVETEVEVLHYTLQP